MAREETGSPQTCPQSCQWVGEAVISRGAVAAVALVGVGTWVDGWELHWAGGSPSLFLSHRRSPPSPPAPQEPQRGSLGGRQGLDDKDRSHLGMSLWVVHASGAVELGAGRQPALCVRELGGRG